MALKISVLEATHQIEGYLEEIERFCNWTIEEALRDDLDPKVLLVRHYRIKEFLDGITELNLALRLTKPRGEK
jgi:hypothetical protein